MRTASIRIRLLVIAVVVALSVWAIYPPDQKIKLGLDLKGGVHLVLRVKADDALHRQTPATGTALNGLRRETVQQASRRSNGVSTNSASPSPWSRSTVMPIESSCSSLVSKTSRARSRSSSQPRNSD